MPPGDRVERVADEIENHLLELHRVAHDPEVARDVLFDLHAGGLDLALEQEQRALDRALDRDRLGMAGLALARKRLEVAGDVRHALGEIVDEVEVARHLREFAALGEDFRARHEGADRRQRLVDLVRDRGRHLTERGKLAGLHQLVLRGAQPRLGAPALLDLGVQRRVGIAQLARALRHLPLQLGARATRFHIGPVPLHQVEQQQDQKRRNAAADDTAVALVVIDRSEIDQAMDGPAVLGQRDRLAEIDRSVHPGR